MVLPVLLILLCAALAFIGIWAAIAYFRLSTFSSCAPPQPEPREAPLHFRVNQSIRRRHTVMETNEAINRMRANVPVQPRFWPDVQRYRRTAARLEAVIKAAEAHRDK